MTSPPPKLVLTATGCPGAGMLVRRRGGRDAILPVHQLAQARAVFGNVKEARIVNRDDYERHAPSGSWIATDSHHGSGFTLLGRYLPHHQP